MNKETFSDLIYDDYKREFLERFPNAVITDASDFVHESRFKIELPKQQEDEYLEWVCLEGFGALSITIGMMLYETGGRAKIKKWLSDKKEVKS